MGWHVGAHRRIWLLLLVALAGAGACSSAPAETVDDPAPAATIEVQQVLFPTATPDLLRTPEPEPTPVLTPAAFTLPQTCEELAVYAEDQAAIITSMERGSQPSVDAQSAYNASVFEQELLGCFS